MRIRILGAGTMGRGIAQWAAVAGHTVELADARPEAVAAAIEVVTGQLRREVSRGRMPRSGADAASARLHALDDPLAPADRTDLVIEAVSEDPAAKTGLLTAVERLLPPRALIASNTSSLSITRLGAALADPGRFAGAHFFNPAPLMRVVEVVPGAATRPETTERLVALVRETGHRAVVVADTPGFLVNHAGRGLGTEALALLEESVAGPAAVDRIARDVLGLRMGPFELMDLTGLDVTAAVNDAVWSGFRHSERLRPSYLTPGRVAAGLLGRKTGRGFHDYRDGAPGGRPPEPDPPAGDPLRALRVAGAGPDREAVLAAVPERDGPSPVVLVPTWGTTVARAVAEHGLPPDRTFGLDPLSATGPRRVLALTPAADPAAARDAAAALRAGPGAPAVTAVRDTAGGVAQRLLASVTSVAASLAERSIASPEDIDAAVTAGLGYPRGPLAWAEQLGAARMLELQRNLLAATGDARYRPTRWLTERAQLGLPLTAAGTAPEDVFG